MFLARARARAQHVASCTAHFKRVLGQPPCLCERYDACVCVYGLRRVRERVSWCAVHGHGCGVWLHAHVVNSMWDAFAPRRRAGVMRAAPPHMQPCAYIVMCMLYMYIIMLSLCIRLTHVRTMAYKRFIKSLEHAVRIFACMSSLFLLRHKR